MSLPTEMDALVSTLREDGLFIDFKLVRKPVPHIEKPTDVIVRMEAAPINPSDIITIFGSADRANAQQSQPGVVSAPIPPKLLEGMRMTPYGFPREGDLLAGNEGSGVVVAAGSDPKAQALVGKVVALFGNGGHYAAYRRVKAPSNAVMEMPAGITPAQAASSFVNPMTALGFVSTMRAEGHTALVHTAAASQLGQMLSRICMQDGITLVNVVRKPEQEAILKAINPKAICINQTSPTFVDDLASAIRSASASLAFDATGGGPLSAQVLTAIDRAGLSRSGKQLYNYGLLDTSRSTMTKDQRERTSFFLMPEWQARNKNLWGECSRRVANEITTTFATRYTAEVGMAEAATVQAVLTFGKQETGKKYLLNPQKVVGAKL